MRSISLALQNALREPAVHTAWCVRLVRRDGVALGLTSHDRDIWLDGLRYRAHPSMTLSSLTASNKLNVDTLEMAGVLSHQALAADDLLAGRYDGAKVSVLLMDWMQPESGSLLVAQGHLGDVSNRDDSFTAEIRSLTQALQAEVGEVYTPECRAELGDARCKVALARFTRLSTISAISSDRQMSISGAAETDGWFTYGRLRWITGANAGLSMAVAASAGAVLTLRERPPFPVAEGDRVEVRAGCDKWFATCRDKFANGPNYRGEPFIPGIDSMVRYPGV